jgi:hypothetical protein
MHCHHTSLIESPSSRAAESLSQYPVEKMSSLQWQQKLERAFDREEEEEEEEEKKKKKKKKKKRKKTLRRNAQREGTQGTQGRSLAMGQFDDENWEEKDSEVVVAGARRQFA